MTTAEIDLVAAREARARRVRDVRAASNRLRRAEAALDAAVAARNDALIEAHGDRRDGGLSYEELAEATATTPEKRISKGRVIQIVQGKSAYSLRQKKAAVPEVAD